MKKAIFLNGVFESVLEEILNVQKNNPSIVCFLQPYATGKITLLVQNPPSKDNPTHLYISTTKNLNEICYKASIVGWENKQGLFTKQSAKRLNELNQHIKKHQPGENEIYPKIKGKKCANLISIVNLQKLPSQLPAKILIKTNNGEPLRPRSQAGGWVYVYELPAWVGNEEITIREQFNEDMNRSIKDSKELNDTTRKKRLSLAPKKPKSIQVISRAYRRNPDVIVEVLKRANGKCEHCGKDAPFTRAKDDSPYLEIHHRVFLSKGGNDTIENAMALCPNCHREFHYGIK